MEHLFLMILDHTQRRSIVIQANRFVILILLLKVQRRRNMMEQVKKI
jgi:phosphate starvation-inducible membrane PsiE